VPEQQPPAGFEASRWTDPTAIPYQPPAPPAAPSDPWAPAIPQQPAYDQPFAPPASGQTSTPPHQAPEYQAPQYPAPQYPAPQFPAPQFPAPPNQPPPNQVPQYPAAPYQQSGYGAQPPGYPPTGWGVPGPPPAYGWPTAPPRRRRTGLIIGVVAAVVVVVLGGLAAIGSATGDTNRNSGNATKSTSSTSGKSTITIGDGTALLGAIITPSSAGHAQTIPGTSHGVMTLDQLVSLSFDNDATEKDRLTDRGFEAAAQREWINSDDVQVDIQLIQFKDAAGAEEHVSNQVDAYGRDDDMTGTFDIAGVSGGKGFEKSALDSYGNRSATLMASAGNIAVLMFVFTPHDFDRSTETSVIAKQIAALRA
jgi:hypothetical protein